MNFYQTAESLLLSPNGVDVRELDRHLVTAQSAGADFADIYCEYSRSESWSLEDRIVKGGSFAIQTGFGIRAISGEKTAFAYADRVSPEALAGAAKNVRSIAAAGVNGRTQQLCPSSLPAPLYTHADPSLAIPDAQKIECLKKLDLLARAKDPRVQQVMASMAMEWVVVLVARSDGHLAADVRPLCRLRLEIIAEQNGRRESGVGGGGGRIALSSLCEEERLSTYVEQAVSAALLKLEARPAPAGIMPVVLGPGWPGVLLHEAVGHGLEGDFNRKGTSAFAGRIGEQVAAKGVTVVDNGTLPDRRGSLTIDDEGTPSQNNVLIEDGILCGYLQ
ncbi:MAG: hypothetical protein RLZZ502_1895, partial [Pseudomonadota bacterium]